MGYSYFKNKTRAQLAGIIMDNARGLAELMDMGDVIWTIERGRIRCYMIECDGGEWGYDAISEDEYPYAFDCPLDFLDKVEPTCPEWRERVRAYHAQEMKS